jgi:outer membrane protein TolC
VHDAYQRVLAAMGVTATLRIRIEGGGVRRLPDRLDLPVDSIIRLALSQRPDVAASYAALKASQSGVVAARAEFMPKVFVSGALKSGSSDFNVTGLPTIGSQSSSTGILIGATVPLYDGGVRDAQLKRAQSQAAAAEESFRKTQMEAVTEIVVAFNTLRTALASYKAAGNLTSAASITYDAAVEAYKNGVGTVMAATEADTDLLNARLARVEAYAASLISAADLAFMIGAMTSADSLGSLAPR